MITETTSNVCPKGALGLHTCAQHYHPVPLILPDPDEEPELPEHRENERRLGNRVFDPQPFENDTFGECEIRIDIWGAPTARWSQQERMLREWCLFYGNTVLAPHEAVVATPWYLTAQYIAKRLQCNHDQAMTIAACLKILDLSKRDCQEVLTWAFQTQDITFASTTLETFADAAAIAESGISTPSQMIIPESLAMAESLASIAEALYYHSITNRSLEHTENSFSARKEWQQAEARVIELKRRPGFLQKEYGKYLQPVEHIPDDDAMEHRSSLPNHQIDNLADTEEDTDEIIIPDEQEEEICTPEEIDWAPFVKWEEGSLDEAEGIDFSYPTEAWHICDETNDQDWEYTQPSEYIIIINRARFAKTISELGEIGKLAFKRTTWSTPQKSVFWDAYHARHNALAVQVLRIKKVRKAIEKIQRTAVQDLPLTAAKLFAFTKQQPSFYSKEALTFMWSVLNQRRPVKQT